MNYINSGVSHWFVFCEALYLYRLLRANTFEDQVRWYILTGWCKSFDERFSSNLILMRFTVAPLCLTIITYTTRFILKTDLYTCWFEPSAYDWILHGPNVILQLVIGRMSL